MDLSINVRTKRRSQLLFFDDQAEGFVSNHDHFRPCLNRSHFSFRGMLDVVDQHRSERCQQRTRDTFLSDQLFILRFTFALRILDCGFTLRAGSAERIQVRIRTISKVAAGVLAQAIAS